MTRSRWYLSVLALVSGLALTTSAQDPGEEPLAQRIFWNPYAPDQAYFLPAGVLIQTDLEDLPLAPNQLRALRGSLERAESAEMSSDVEMSTGKRASSDPEALEKRIKAQVEEGLAAIDPSPENKEGVRRILERQVRAMEEMPVQLPGPCDYADPRGPYEAVPKRFDPAELTRRADFVFVGKIVQRVPGWSAAHGMKTATMVYVEALDVLKGSETEVWPGKVVPYREWSGEFELLGKRLCTVPRPGTLPTREGDLLLLFADIYHRDATFIDVFGAFPILDGMVLPQPYKPEWGLDLGSLAEIERAVLASAAALAEGG